MEMRDRHGRYRWETEMVVEIEVGDRHGRR